jgi:hypothetical protein
MPIVPKEILQLSTKRPLLAKLAVAVATKPPSRTGLVRYTPEPAQGALHRLSDMLRPAGEFFTIIGEIQRAIGTAGHARNSHSVFYV